MHRQTDAHLQGQRRPTLKLELMIFQLNYNWKIEFPTLLMGTKPKFIGTDAGCFFLSTTKLLKGKESMLMPAGLQASTWTCHPCGIRTKPIWLLGTSTHASSEPSGTTNGLSKLPRSSREQSSTLIKRLKPGSRLPLSTSPWQWAKIKLSRACRQAVAMHLIQDQ